MNKLIDEVAFKQIYSPYTDVDKVSEWREIIGAYELAKQSNKPTGVIETGYTGKKGVHFSHCYQGEYSDCCKYGDADCPANPSKTS